MHPARRKRVIRGTGGAGKAVVHGLLERSTDSSKASRIRAKVVPNARKSTLAPILAENIKPGLNLYTDTSMAYARMETEFIHELVDHAKAYVVGNCHTNSLENFWSLLKRTLSGTYVNCAPVHLQKYLDEQVARFNERKDVDSERFVNTLQRVSGRRLTYNELTGKEESESAA